ncbi:hypothetical protein O181_010772 [Austropuccinia psidii MF-1]|uniref:Uncharacterized protein n=1 Tax=Austropuccinia psidii MF-1 TaxID=1389203 RepID=A0A9Q3GLI4_9BASI|nr:hypothetical protein [Austropuccinia psidii MF-1]
MTLQLLQEKLKSQSPSKKHLTSAYKRPVFTPSKTNKTRPNQLNMKDTPEGFKLTKNAFYAHIRIIWVLIYEKLIPIEPEPSLIKEFNNHFDYIDEIQQVTNRQNAVALIPKTDIITLRGTKPGRKKHPIEKLSDKKFSEKYWDQLTQKYDLSHETPTYEDGHESNSEDEDIESDSSSDMDRESSEENEEEENRNLDSDEEMADKSQAVGHFSNAEYSFE